MITTDYDVGTGTSWTGATATETHPMHTVPDHWYYVEAAMNVWDEVVPYLDDSAPRPRKPLSKKQCAKKKKARNAAKVARRTQKANASIQEKKGYRHEKRVHSTTTRNRKR